MREPSFSLGIEEEYLLVDRKSRDLVTSMPPSMLQECAARCEDQLVSPELLRAQIEVGTRVCRNMTEARRSLAELRTAVAEVAASLRACAHCGILAPLRPMDPAEAHRTASLCGALRGAASGGAPAFDLRHACATWGLTTMN